MPVQRYTIAHTGQTLGDDSVTRSQNQNAPQRETTVLEWTCPDNYDAINYVGRRDATRFVPRSVEQEDSITGGQAVALEADLQPINGEPDLEDQDHLTVQVVDVTAGAMLSPDDYTVDYATDEVTVDGDATTDGNTVKFFPVITEGSIKFYGKNALGQDEGPVDNWPFPVRRFADMDQDKRGTEINLDGTVTWEPFETVEVRLDSPRQIVWEDDDHPEAYASSLEQDVEITF